MRRVVTGAHAPAGIGVTLLRLCHHRLGCGKRGIARKLDAIAPCNEAARLDEARRLQGFMAHQHARAEHEAVRDAVGLVGDHRSEPKTAAADLDVITQLEAEAAQQQRIGGDAINPVLHHQRI